MTQQEAAAVLGQLVDVLRGTGAHADHTRTQVGRCVYCSCGARVLGRLSPRGPVDDAGEPVFEVVLADGFVSYRTSDRDVAEQRAAKHPGAVVRQGGAS